MADYSYAATGSGLIAPHHFPSMLYTFARDGTWERFDSTTHDFRCSYNCESFAQNDDDTGTTSVGAHQGNWNETDYPSVTSPTFSGSSTHPDWFKDWIELTYPDGDTAPFVAYEEQYLTHKTKTLTYGTGDSGYRGVSYPPVREALWGTAAGSVSAFYCGISWCKKCLNRPFGHYGTNPYETYVPGMPGGEDVPKCKNCNTTINPYGVSKEGELLFGPCWTGPIARGNWNFGAAGTADSVLGNDGKYYNYSDIAHHETSQMFSTAAMGHPIGAMCMWYYYKYVARNFGPYSYCRNIQAATWTQNRGVPNGITALVRGFLTGFQWMDPSLVLDHFWGKDTRQHCEEAVLQMIGSYFGGTSSIWRKGPYGFFGSKGAYGTWMPRVTSWCEPWMSMYGYKYVDRYGTNWGKQVPNDSSWPISSLGLYAVGLMLLADQYVRDLGVIDDGSVIPARADMDWAIISRVTRNKLLNYRDALFDHVAERFCWDRGTNSADDIGEINGPFADNVDTGVWNYAAASGNEYPEDVENTQLMPSRPIVDDLISTICSACIKEDGQPWQIYTENEGSYHGRTIYPKLITTMVSTIPGVTTTGWTFRQGPRANTARNMWFENSTNVIGSGALAINSRDYDGGFYDKTSKYYQYLEYLLHGDKSGTSKPDYIEFEGTGQGYYIQHGMDIVERVIADEGGGGVEDPDDPGGEVEIYSFRGYMDLTATLAAFISEKQLSGAMNMVGSLTVDEDDTKPVGVVRAVTFIGGMSVAATMGRTIDVTAPMFTGAMNVTVGEHLFRDDDDGPWDDFVGSEFYRTFTGAVDMQATNLGISVADTADRSNEDKDMLEYMTLEHMRQQVARHIGDTSTARAQKIDEWINTAYSDVARAHRWPNLMRGRESGVAAVAGQKYLYLPKEVQQLYFIFTSGLVDIAPHQVIENMYTRSPTTIDTSGLIESWADAGEIGIKEAFSSTAEQIQIDPPSGAAASDTFNVLIQGVVDDDEVSETMTLAGVTSGSSTNTYDDLYSVSTDGNHTGTVTVKGVTSGTTYATIGQYDRTARYRRIRLHQVPSTAESVVIYYKKRPLRLVYDDQVPEIPVSQYLIERAVASHYSQQRKWGPAMQMHEARAQKILDDLIGEEEMQGERVVQSMPAMTKGGARGLAGRGTIVVNNG